MAGGFWGKGNNPFFNHDFDAAQRDREAHRASEEAHKDRLAHELASQAQKSSSDADLSRLRIQKNAMEAGYEEKIKKYESDILEMRKAFWVLAIRSHVFEKTINDFMAKHPDLTDEIFDDMQAARNYCNAPEYQDKWWEWARKVDIKLDMDFLKFPYQKRELKK